MAEVLSCEDDSVSVLSDSEHAGFDHDLPRSPGVARYVEAEVVLTCPVVNETEFEPPASNTRARTAKIVNKKRGPTATEQTRDSTSASSKPKKSRTGNVETTESTKLDSVLDAIQNLTSVISGKRESAQLETSRQHGEDIYRTEVCVDGNDDACRFSLFGSEDAHASESEDDFEFQLADVFDKHKFGNALKYEKVVSSISTVVKTKADISGLCDKYRIPRNMDSLVPPKTNTEVWHLIGGQAKSRDVSMQELQKLLGHGLVPLLHAVESLRSQKMDVKSTKDLLSDSLSTLCNLFYELSVRRRFFMRGFIPQKHLAASCKADVPISTDLFGDNVAKRIKDLDDLNKCTNRYRGGYSGYRHGPKNFTGPRGQSQWGRGSFQYRGGPRGRSSSRRGRRHGQAPAASQTQGQAKTTGQ